MAATAENLNQSRRMNLSTLKQRDPFITAIVDTASQVALYSFSSKANEWVSWICGSAKQSNPLSVSYTGRTGILRLTVISCRQGESQIHWLWASSLAECVK